MFWNRGFGRVVRIGAWLAFGACLVFGSVLSELYGHPCPGQESGFGKNLVMVCGPAAIGRIGNTNTLVGLGFLALALFATAARRAERRRLDLAREREAQSQETHPGRIRIRIRRADGTASPRRD